MTCERLYVPTSTPGVCYLPSLEMHFPFQELTFSSHSALCDHFIYPVYSDGPKLCRLLAKDILTSIGTYIGCICRAARLATTHGANVDCRRASRSDSKLRLLRKSFRPRGVNPATRKPPGRRSSPGLTRAVLILHCPSSEHAFACSGGRVEFSHVTIYTYLNNVKHAELSMALITQPVWPRL
jgi:hypothetical protein